MNNCKRSGKIDALTGFRFMAIMVIIISHLEFIGEYEKIGLFYKTYIHNATLGVDYFFMLSGFGMMLSYQKKSNSPMINTIEIQNGLEKYQFNIGEFSGIATAGDQEDIELSIKDNDGEILGKGRVSLTIGYIDFDEDGCASNGINDSIEYCYEDIAKALENIAELIEQDIKNEENIAKEIEKVITTE